MANPTDIVMVITRCGDEGAVHLIAWEDGVRPTLHTLSGSQPTNDVAVAISSLWAELLTTRPAEIVSTTIDGTQVGVVAILPIQVQQAMAMLASAASVMVLPEAEPVTEALALL